MGFGRHFLTVLFVFYVVLATGQQKYAMVIHGGAGVMSEDKMTAEKQLEYKTKLNEALELGEKMLKEGAKATDVVVNVINILEDSPLFNAGKGAVFTNDEKVELDGRTELLREQHGKSLFWSRTDDVEEVSVTLIGFEPTGYPSNVRRKLKKLVEIVI